jgi:KUP system potassium uptake protein
VLVIFLSFDIPFFVANLFKFFDGGFVPVAIGSGFFVTMWIWKKGRSLLGRHFIANSPPLDKFLEHLDKRINYRIPGTAVFMASNANGVPPVVSRMVKRFHVLHKTVILLTVTSEDVPYYGIRGDDASRIEVQSLDNGFYRVLIRYGFMESPNIPKVMELAFNKLDLYYWARDILYILGHETFVDQQRGSLQSFQHSIFAFLSRNARNATDYFKLPPEQVIELGTQIDL